MKKMFITALLFLGIFAFLNSNVYADYIWSMKKPVAWYPFSWLDHTYACVGSSNNCYTCPAQASKTGGNPVSGGYGDADDAVCYAYCTLTYGFHGVCHQHTNRVLYAGGETLSVAVTGYSYSSFRWGLCGTNWSSCQSQCD